MIRSPHFSEEKCALKLRRIRDARRTSMSEEPENFTLALLRKLDAKVDSLRDEVSAMREVMVTKAEMRSEINTLRADVASDMVHLEKRLGDQIVGLRRSVMEYHSSVIGHGVLLTELEERVRRLEGRVGV
jgi:hypothetical protein